MSYVKPIFDPEKAGRPMRVAAFMSGSGTNIRKLIEHEKKLKDAEGCSPFEVIFIFSDRSDDSCRGEAIAREYAIPYFSYDIREFYKKRSLKLTVKTEEGMKARMEFDKVAKRLISAFDIDLNALGGYMSYITVDRCVNVHPADLSILNPDGTRRYVGDNAVLDAIVAGEKHLCSSTLWTNRGIDAGPLLMISKPIDVCLPEPVSDLLADREKLFRVVQEHQERLKAYGDWEIFPLTVEMIARGRFAFNERGEVFFDGRPVPYGYRL